MGLMDLFKKKSSGDVAKDRLKLLLISDRANCSRFWPNEANVHCSY